MNKCNIIGSLGHFITGIGTLGIGVAAIIALCKSDNVLDKILTIQKQGDTIKEAVNLLSNSNKQIDSGIHQIQLSVDQLSRIIRTRESFKIVQASNKIMKESKDESKLKELFSTENSSLKPGDVYIPKNKVSKAIEILKSKDREQQKENLLAGLLEMKTMDLRN